MERRTLMAFKAFGKAPSGARLARMEGSPRFHAGVFENPEPTDMRLQGASFAKVFWEFMTKTPPTPTLHAVKTDLHLLPEGQMVWFGHSGYYLNLPGLKIAVDPVLSGNASPFRFFAKAFPGTDVYKPGDLPDLDVLVITHDHYDHLDWTTVIALNPRFIVTALGVGADLEYWGIPPEKIIELDLGESFDRIPGVRLTAAPARHFSGRGAKRNGTLWMSIVLEINEKRVLIGGDSGYGSHFAAIGQTYGPFDLAILECGQYGVHWPFIHMFPEQTAQAARDLGARALLPVHWGKFALSMHPWDEPIRRLMAAAGGLTVATPRIGQAFPVLGPYPTEHWWEAV
ncbi:MAG TPA: MBL fold metallo-hydrolase [Dinghuibacter sp.]|uniref:MBL fold metallo-hydrolase n=1 Tax=Dinghuibacter sp. TaxID=2024697 RepID=UPI002CA6BDEA|nr:MBL fold metallo-hydrolase [Dinghuibacter sp.]HTJ14703.1 MBL fold metallo-hydrolase [Dinghuibacter sp.]